MGLASNIVPTAAIGTALSAASGTISLASSTVGAVHGAVSSTVGAGIDTACALEKTGEETLSNAVQGVGSAIQTANSAVVSAISSPIIGLTSLLGGGSSEEKHPEPKINPNDKYRPTVVSSSMHKPAIIQPQKIEPFSSSFPMHSSVTTVVQPKPAPQTNPSILGFSF